MEEGNRPSDLRRAITGAAVLGGLLLFIGIGFPSGAWLSHLFGSNPLSAERREIEGWPILSLTNKGTSDVAVESVRINGRSEPACQLKINKKLRVGDSQAVIILGCVGFTGKMVRAEVNTDQGSFEFTW